MENQDQGEAVQHLTINMHNYRPKCGASWRANAAQIRSWSCRTGKKQNMSNNNDLDHLLPIASANKSDEAHKNTKPCCSPIQKTDREETLHMLFNKTIKEAEEPAFSFQLRGWSTEELLAFGEPKEQEGSRTGQVLSLSLEKTWVKESRALQNISWKCFQSACDFQTIQRLCSQFLHFSWGGKPRKSKYTTKNKHTTTNHYLTISRTKNFRDFLPNLG